MKKQAKINSLKVKNLIARCDNSLLSVPKHNVQWLLRSYLSTLTLFSNAVTN